MPQVSFAKDIRPLFRPVDIAHMKPLGVVLDDYNYISDPRTIMRMRKKCSKTSLRKMETFRRCHQVALTGRPNRSRFLQSGATDGYQP